MTRNHWLPIQCGLMLGAAYCGLVVQRAGARDDGSPLRVLFVGNSYTYVNDLPGTLNRLAASGGHEVVVDMAAKGGWTLAQHAASAETLGKLRGAKWDFVVLQEQSQIPAVEQVRAQAMYPAARQLARDVEAAGAKCVLFAAWAHRDGMPENGLSDFESMQGQIDQAYVALARELHAPIAPVGLAWARARRQHPQLNLWQADGSHPTEEGTYLAACVFYAAFFRESPVGLAERGRITEKTAGQLQSVAAQTVLSETRQSTAMPSRTP